MLLLLVAACCFTVVCCARPNDSAEWRLQKFLLHDLQYNPNVRPVNWPTTVEFSGILQQEWTDAFLRWNPSEYGGIKRIRLPVEKIWVPDIELYTRFTVDRVALIGSARQRLPMVASDGTVTYMPQIRARAACKTSWWFNRTGDDTRMYDHYSCHLEFGSWDYGESEIDLQLRSPVVDLRSFKPQYGCQLGPRESTQYLVRPPNVENVAFRLSINYTKIRVRDL